MMKLIMISINWKLNSISTLLEILIAKIAKLHIKSAHFETSKNIYSFFRNKKSSCYWLRDSSAFLAQKTVFC